MTDKRGKAREKTKDFLGKRKEKRQAVLCPLSSEERCPFLTEGHPKRRALDVRGTSLLACRLLFTHPEVES
jgi:hypothetical protein